LLHLVLLIWISHVVFAAGLCHSSLV